MLCWAERPAQPISTARPTSATAEWKGQMWSQTILTGDWFSPLCPAPTPKLFSLSLWIIPTFNEKQRGTARKLFWKGWGDTWEDKHRKKTSQIFSIKNGWGSVHPDLLVCAWWYDYRKKGRGHYYYYFLKRYLDTEFISKEIPDPLDGKNNRNFDYECEAPGNDNLDKKGYRKELKSGFFQRDLALPCSLNS